MVLMVLYKYRVGNLMLLGHCLFSYEVTLIFKGTEASWEGTKSTFHESPGAPRPVLKYKLSVYSPFSDRVGLPLHNIHNPSPFTSIMDIFLVDLKFGHIHFYTL